MESENEGSGAAGDGEFEPSLNGGDGRDQLGRFAPGNNLGRGNPLAKQVNQLRSVLLDKITNSDFGAVVDELLRRAKAGENWAILEVLNRALGKSVQSLSVEADEHRAAPQIVINVLPPPDDRPEAIEEARRDA